MDIVLRIWHLDLLFLSVVCICRVYLLFAPAGKEGHRTLPSLQTLVNRVNRHAFNKCSKGIRASFSGAGLHLLEHDTL